ncbi:MAG: tetrathionate reductase family octaheme c-type cytochrome [Chloroflexi bacterium]|nr:tetrathionate reductase family octaheme c-type cytochrome [Chloroflexota bacterium]
MNHARIWVTGLIVTLAVIVIPIIYFAPKPVQARDNPRASLPQHKTHVSHADLMPGPYATGQEVTQACLECHSDSATQVMATSHWTWESQPFTVPGRPEPVTIGKINQINNFCISAQGNQKSCMSCHAGYDWQEGAENTNLTKPENVDCLVCHAQSGYAKGQYGNPADGVDLAAAAQSVAAPTRNQCGKCHFNGGGGNGVKHGDLDETLYYPAAETDVHMGEYNLLCTDCHVTQDHQIKGRLVADNYTISPDEQVACADCHAANLHADERLNTHAQTVACQTCHIPSMATKDPTKVYWDWSTAGLGLQPDDHFEYLKIKGSFEYASNVQPAYLWFNGNLAYRYLLGDTIDPNKPTSINLPAGDIDDSAAKIFPFKLHVAKQPYDTGYNYLLAPVTAGPDGYWTTFDWDSAFRLAEERMGLKYSGNYSFAETWMYWPTTHMVQPKENALQCNDCHSANGRLDWQALGYPGDPMEWGGRFTNK